MALERVHDGEHVDRVADRAHHHDAHAVERNSPFAHAACPAAVARAETSATLTRLWPRWRNFRSHRATRWKFAAPIRASPAAPNATRSTSSTSARGSARPVRARSTFAALRSG